MIINCLFCDKELNNATRYDDEYHVFSCLACNVCYNYHAPFKELYSYYLESELYRVVIWLPPADKYKIGCSIHRVIKSLDYSSKIDLIKNIKYVPQNLTPQNLDEKVRLLLTFS